MSIKSWKQVGNEVLVANAGGQKLVIKMFINPQTGRQEDFAQFVQKDWCVVLVLTGDEKVLVVSQFKPGRDSVGDELPAVSTEFGYSPDETVMRELRKETGYQTDSKNIIPLGRGYMSPDSSSASFHCFLAVDCVKVGPGKLDENQNIQTRLVPLQEWIGMVVCGAISAPSAVVATIRALPFLDLHIVSVPE